MCYYLYLIISSFICKILLCATHNLVVVRIAVYSKLLFSHRVTFTHCARFLHDYFVKTNVTKMN